MFISASTPVPAIDQQKPGLSPAQKLESKTATPPGSERQPERHKTAHPAGRDHKSRGRLQQADNCGCWTGRCRSAARRASKQASPSELVPARAACPDSHHLSDVSGRYMTAYIAGISAALTASISLLSCVINITFKKIASVFQSTYHENKTKPG
tara:strand:- start:422 stop:883 length:462 start_codon:yes stop_codon:yes gene_type:complete